MINDKKQSIRKKKILIVVDFPNWAYHIMAKYIVKNLSLYFDFYICFIRFEQALNWRIFKKFLGTILYRAKNIHYFIRKYFLPNRYDIIIYLGWYMPFCANLSRFSSDKIIKGIYTDGFPPQGMQIDPKISIKDFLQEYCGDAETLVCGSESILNLYRNHWSKKNYFANSFISPEVFKPSNILKKSENREFVVGWTGNPNRKFKGFYDFVVPAIEKAAKSRPGIMLKTRFQGPFKTLHNFYRNVNLVLIASTADAGPGMFLEAGLCGVPAISTVIGIPSSVIKHKINGYFVKRDVEDMAIALIELYDNRDLLIEMSQNIRIDIINYFEKYDMVNTWKRIFLELL